MLLPAAHHMAERWKEIAVTNAAYMYKDVTPIYMVMHVTRLVKAMHKRY